MSHMTIGTASADVRSELSDKELLHRYAAWRDEFAFAELMGRYGPLVARICRRVTKSYDDAEDLAQDCFLQLASYPAVVSGNVRSWLCSAAYSRAVDHTRRAETRKRCALRQQRNVPVADTASEPPACLLCDLDSALRTIPPLLKEPFLQRYVLERPCSEIAAVAGVTRSTVASRVNRALNQLRQRLRHISMAS